MEVAENCELRSILLFFGVVVPISVWTTWGEKPAGVKEFLQLIIAEVSAHGLLVTSLWTYEEGEHHGGGISHEEETAHLTEAGNIRFKELS